MPNLNLLPTSHFFQARILARQYKELPEKEQRKWDKKAEQEKIRYQEEMKHYIPSEDPTGGKKKKQKKDPNAPKRNSKWN
jgi:HMG (high mobility group) box